MEAIDLVTVVFRGEIDLLRLQAASLARFVPFDLIRRVFIVINDADEERCRKEVKAQLVHYGPFASKVEIILPDALFALRRRGGQRSPGAALRLWFTHNRCRYPFGRKSGWRCNRGWAMQQALKLASARVAQAPFVLILDAKNHFVKSVSADTFISPAGRARSIQVVPSDKHHRWIVASFRRLGITPPEHSEPAPPAATPFCVETRILRDTLEDVESAVGPVEVFFARKKSPEAEFMLIYASVVGRHGAWLNIFDEGLSRPATLGRSGLAEAVFAAVESGSAEVLAVHRTRIDRLAPAERARLERIWRQRGLPVLRAGA